MDIKYNNTILDNNFHRDQKQGQKGLARRVLRKSNF